MSGVSERLDFYEFADAFGSLPDETQIEYFNALRKGINSLKKQDGLLLEPVA